MAFKLVKRIKNPHEDVISAIAFDPVKRVAYTAAEGDKTIKVMMKLLEKLDAGLMGSGIG